MARYDIIIGVVSVYMQYMQYMVYMVYNFVYYCDTYCQSVQDEVDGAGR
jgi:hypothetical protein